MSDKKNFESKRNLRYTASSGEQSPHGRVLYRVTSQDGQSMSFHESTGQNATPNGPGNSRHVLINQGQSYEYLGDGFIHRKNIDSCMPAKHIKCKRGDVYIDADNGDIVLRGNNIRLHATGGDKDGDLTLAANKLIDIGDGTGSVRIQAEDITMKASKDLSIVATEQIQMQYGFFVASAFADENFGAISAHFKPLELKTL